MNSSTEHDPLVGTWVLNPSRSQFDANHRPQAGTLVIERDDQGRYLVTAEGIGEKGQKVSERPQTIVPDGQPRPLPDFPGLAVTSTRPDEYTLHTDVRREDGSIAGQGTVRGVRGWSFSHRDHCRVRFAASPVRATCTCWDKRIRVESIASTSASRAPA